MEPAACDIRRLGVAVERIVVSEDGLTVEAVHSHAALRDGFHDDEPTHRWTNGRARLPQTLLRPFDGEFTVQIHLADSGMRYRRLSAPAPALAGTVAA
jgi:hypothetical protein